MGALNGVLGPLALNGFIAITLKAIGPPRPNTKLITVYSFCAVGRDYFRNSEPIVIDHNSAGRDDIADDLGFRNREVIRIAER